MKGLMGDFAVFKIALSLSDNSVVVKFGNCWSSAVTVSFGSFIAFTGLALDFALFFTFFELAGDRSLVCSY